MPTTLWGKKGKETRVEWEGVQVAHVSMVSVGRGPSKHVYLPPHDTHKVCGKNETVAHL